MSAVVWFYGHGDQQHGPVDDSTLRAKIAAGELTGEALVWREGMLDWAPLAGVAELQQLAIYAAPASYGSASVYPGQGGAVTSGLAIASMVCGIVSVMVMFCHIGALAGIPAVICGHMALRKIRVTPYEVAGRGMAIAGLVTGYIGIAATLAMVLFVLIALVSV